MNGLLEKDLRLVLQRKQALILFIVIMVMMGISNGSFIVSYGTLLFGIFTVGTLSYDEFDNCFPFLMTLPITKKEYVQEKFLFCGGGILAGWLVSMVLYAILTAIQGNAMILIQEWAEELTILSMFLGIISVMIPVQLKYDVEKSRVVLMIIGGLAFALFGLGSMFGFVADLLRVMNSLPSLSVLCTFILISTILIILMYVWSIRILDNKDL